MARHKLLEALGQTGDSFLSLLSKLRTSSVTDILNSALFAWLHSPSLTVDQCVELIGWVLTGRDPTEFHEILKTRFCEQIFHKNEVVFKCLECQLAQDDSVIVCFRCFDCCGCATRGHEFQFLRATADGCCSCGDEQAWSGICVMHSDLAQSITAHKQPLSSLFSQPALEAILQFCCSCFDEEGAVFSLAEEDAWATVLFQDNVHSHDYVTSTVSRVLSNSCNNAEDLCMMCRLDGCVILTRGNRSRCSWCVESLKRHGLKADVIPACKFDLHVRATSVLRWISETCMTFKGVGRAVRRSLRSQSSPDLWMKLSALARRPSLMLSEADKILEFVAFITQEDAASLDRDNGLLAQSTHHSSHCSEWRINVSGAAPSSYTCVQRGQKDPNIIMDDGKTLELDAMEAYLLDDTKDKSCTPDDDMASKRGQTKKSKGGKAADIIKLVSDALDACRLAPACIMDFPYSDAGDFKGALNLKGDDRYLERAVAFKLFDHDSSTQPLSQQQPLGQQRIIVHVHTLVRWGDRYNICPRSRSNDIVSVNIALVMQHAPGKAFNCVDSAIIVPQDESLRRSWRDYVSDKHGKDQCDIIWSLEDYNDKPKADKCADMSLYSLVRRVILHGYQLFDLSEGNGYFFDNVKNCNKLLRSGQPRDEYEIIAVHDGSMFESLPSEICDQEVCSNTAISALCIGVDRYYRTYKKLNNAVHDASAMHMKLSVLESCASHLMVDPDSRLEIIQGLRGFLKKQAAMKQRPEIIILFFAGHGMQVGSDIFLLPCNAQPRDVVELSEYAVSLENVFRFFVDELERPTGTSTDAAPHLLVMLDACRTSLNGLWEKEHFYETADPVRRPKSWSLCLSTSRGAGAYDGLCTSETHSPFVSILLDHTHGMFAPNRPLRAALEYTESQLSDVAGQKATLINLHHIKADFCLNLVTVVDGKQPHADQCIHHGLPFFAMVGNPNYQARKFTVQHDTSAKDDVEDASFLQERLKQCGSFVVLHGMGGIGKTTIAAEYVHKSLKSGSYSAIFWFGASDPQVLENDCVSAARSLGLISHDRRDTRYASDRLHHWLSCNKLWLIVLDDVCDPTDIHSARLPAHCGSILVTTRISGMSWTGLTRKQNVVEICSFSQAEAQTFMLKSLGLRYATSAVTAISKRLHYFPLFLAEAASFARSRETDLEDLLEKMEQNSDPCKSAFETSYSLFQGMITLQMSRLQGGLQAAGDLLSVCSFFSNLDIPRTSIWSALFPDYDQNFATLLRCSLLTRGNGSNVQMHPVVRLSVRKLCINNGNARLFLRMAEEILEAAIVVDNQAGAGQLKCMIPHALEAIACGASSHALWERTASVLFERQMDYAGARWLFLKLYDSRICIEVPGPARGKSFVSEIGEDKAASCATTIIMLQRAADADRKWGQYKRAILLLDQAILGCADLQDTEPALKARCLQTKATCLRNLGCYDEAICTQRQAIDALKEAHINDLRLYDSEERLAKIIYWKWKSDCSLSDVQRLLDGGRFSFLLAACRFLCFMVAVADPSTLARVKQNYAQGAEVAIMFLKAKEQRESYLGAHNSSLNAKSAKHIADLKLDMSYLLQAEVIYASLLTQLADRSTSDKLCRAQIMFKQCRICVRTCQYTAGINLFDKALHIYTDILGKDDPRTVRISCETLFFSFHDVWEHFIYLSAGAGVSALAAASLSMAYIFYVTAYAKAVQLCDDSDSEHVKHLGVYLSSVVNDTISLEQMCRETSQQPLSKFTTSLYALTFLTSHFIIPALLTLACLFVLKAAESLFWYACYWSRVRHAAQLMQQIIFSRARHGVVFPVRQSWTISSRIKNSIVTISCVCLLPSILLFASYCSDEAASGIKGFLLELLEATVGSFCRQGHQSDAAAVFLMSQMLADCPVYDILFERYQIGVHSGNASQRHPYMFRPRLCPGEEFLKFEPYKGWAWELFNEILPVWPPDLRQRMIDTPLKKEMKLYNGSNTFSTWMNNLSAAVITNPSGDSYALEQRSTNLIMSKIRRLAVQSDFIYGARCNTTKTVRPLTAYPPPSYSSFDVLWMVTFQMAVWMALSSSVVALFLSIDLVRLIILSTFISLHRVCCKAALLLFRIQLPEWEPMISFRWNAALELMWKNTWGRALQNTNIVHIVCTLDTLREVNMQNILPKALQTARNIVQGMSRNSFVYVTLFIFVVGCLLIQFW